MITTAQKWNRMRAKGRRLWVDAYIILQQDGEYEELPTKQELDGKFEDLPKELQQMLSLADYTKVMSLAQGYVRLFGAPWDVVHQPYWTKFGKEDPD